MSVQNKIRGSLIGGAAGDALGYPIEFMDYDEIISKYGTRGITEYHVNPQTHLAEISDDTQMTLFTATGLMLGMTRGKLRGIMAPLETYCGHAYTTWYKMQCNQPLNDYEYSWLRDVPEMGCRRAPGNTCMSAIGSWKGHPAEGIADNRSKGCGGVMRVAPVALYLNRFPKGEGHISKVDSLGAHVAALTHGHPLGYMPAASLVHIINRIVYSNMSIEQAVRDSIRGMGRHYHGKEYLDDMINLMELALDLSHNDDTDIENISILGGGWVAEETLAIAVYCAVKYSNDFSKALVAAVNHSGDSDSTGAVTGNIIGAAFGYDAIPEKWKQDLECKEVILEIADDLSRDCPMEDEYDYEHWDKAWERKYVENHRYLGKQKSIKHIEASASSIKLVHGSCADQNVDAVVNAANRRLWEGGGICGVIFRKAGSPELTAACSKIQTPLRDGETAITPAFRMKNAKYIIHAVGPDFRSTPNAFGELFNAYYNSLLMLMRNDLHSISFPLISSGIFSGNLREPSKISAVQCCKAYKQFIEDFTDYPVTVLVCAYSQSSLDEAKAAFAEEEIPAEGN